MKLFVGDKYYNINNDIKFDIIKLINYKSVYLGIFSFSDAISISINLRLDLIEISSNQNTGLAVCKLIKYGRFQYIENKKYLKKIEKLKLRLIKSKGKKKNEKEMSFSLFIDIQDYYNKISKINKFLLSNLDVKVFVIAKGRLASKLDLISELLDRIKFDLRDYSFILNGSFADINNQFHLYFYNHKYV